MAHIVVIIQLFLGERSTKMGLPDIWPNSCQALYRVDAAVAADLVELAGQIHLHSGF